MNPQELIHELEARGITLKLCGKNLRTDPEALPVGILTTIQAHKSALIRHLRTPPIGTAESTPDDVGKSEADPPRAGNADLVPVGGDRHDLAVAFLEATEQLLVTVKDERPPSFRTPQLKRDLKRTEAALSEYRAALLPDDPESTATGESYADRFRRLN